MTVEAFAVIIQLYLKRVPHPTLPLLKSLLGCCSPNRRQKPHLFSPLSPSVRLATCVTYKARSALGNMLSLSPLSRLSRRTPTFQPARGSWINMETKSTQTFSPPMPRLRPGEDDKLEEEIKQELVKWRQRGGRDYL